MYLADARLLPLHSKWVGLRVMVDVGTTNGGSFSACSSQWVMPAISVTPKFPSWIDTKGFMSWKKITKDKFHSIDNEAGEVKRPTNSKAIPESFIWVRSIVKFTNCLQGSRANGPEPLWSLVFRSSIKSPKEHGKWFRQVYFNWAKLLEGPPEEQVGPDVEGWG